MDIKENNILGEEINSHWYYYSKAKAMTRLLDKKNVSTVLDIGAGSGFFSKYLLNHSSAKEAWCIDISYKNDVDGLESGKPIHFRQSINSLNADLVLLMDILEHIDDDIGFLKNCIAKVPPGTTFLISVPAFEFLWSEHDIFLEHRRRYMLKHIESIASSTGLKVKTGCYYFGAVFPIAVTTRIIGKLLRKNTQQPRSQLKQHHPLLNTFLAALCHPELSLIKHNRLAGLTVFCLAESRQA